MTKFQFIKTKLQVAEELHRLWDQYPLYKFINGAQWVRQRELEIAESVIDAETWIELCRTVWQQKQQEQSKKQRKSPRY
jgi:hypothetical protein